MERSVKQINDAAEKIMQGKVSVNRELRNRMIGMNEKHMNLVSS